MAELVAAVHKDALLLTMDPEELQEQEVGGALLAGGMAACWLQCGRPPASPQASLSVARDISRPLTTSLPTPHPHHRRNRRPAGGAARGAGRRPRCVCVHAAAGAVGGGGGLRPRPAEAGDAPGGGATFGPGGLVCGGKWRPVWVASCSAWRVASQACAQAQERKSKFGLPHSQELGQQGALETVMDMPTLLTVDDY